VIIISKSAIITRASRERAFLVTVAARAGADIISAESSQDELAQLAGSAGAKVVGKIIQRLNVASKAHYIGKGKLEELQALKEKLDYNVVIFDDELSPLQQRNLEDALEVKVIDRAALILDIFARRARTREGKLQVELAQHQYLLLRLAGQWSHLERLGGGIGTRGPGESQLETDRRIIRQKILRLKKETEKIRKHRQLYRQRRKKSGIPVISLVGYTNAGKSTLLNALSQSAIVSENKLFSTLDPTTRRLVLPDKSIALFSDTVGFIRKLPPAIITAFRATLEELSEASILLHVVDLNSPDAPEQCQTVESVLTDLEIMDKPVVTALNKIDMLLPGDKTWTEKEAIDYLSGRHEIQKRNTVMISAEKKWGLPALLKLIAQTLKQTAHI